MKWLFFSLTFTIIKIILWISRWQNRIIQTPQKIIQRNMGVEVKIINFIDPIILGF
jgi:hypothetical protein